MIPSQSGILLASILSPWLVNSFFFCAVFRSVSPSQISIIFQGKEDASRTEALTVDADQPAFLAGRNTAPNAVEHYLHSLTSCLNSTLVYHASVQGIPVEEVNVTAEGDMNARGFFGISDDVNRGYKDIRINMQVKSPADVETLTKLAMYSPVYEMVSKAVSVDFNLTTK